jgi:beta-carotene ketolase (CrtW type)
MNQKGTYIGVTVITLWLLSLSFLLSVYEINWFNPFTYLFFLVQTHLYTGIFITAHDAMHHTVSKNTKANNAIGTIATGFFAFNYYPRLLKKHHEHHRFVATDKDPDFHHGNFWIWYFNFAKNYITIIQIVLMAITYNVLKLIFPIENVIFYWMIPSIAATFQLFYFGTYLPHRKSPDNKHHSRSQSKNHVWAFISCYFFGYHYEHHDSPNTPWWRLYQKK